MKTFFRVVIAIVILFLVTVTLIWYFGKHKRLHAPPNQNTTIYTPRNTTLHFPLLIAINDIEGLANRKIPVLILNKRIPVHNGKDTLILKITRQGNIRLSTRDQFIYTSIPLKLEAQFVKKLIGDKGITLFKKEPLLLYITAQFKSALSLDELLKVKTESTLLDIDWRQNPSITFAGIKFDLKQKITEQFMERAPEITGKIDRIIYDRVDLRKPVNRIWNNLQRPLHASKKQPDLFIRVNPKSLEIHLDNSINDSLKVNLVFDSKLFAMFSADTASVQRIPFPRKVKISDTEQASPISYLYIHFLFPLEKLNQLARTQLIGKKVKVQGYELVIRDLKITNSRQNIYVKVKHSGSFNGEITVKGFPRLSEDKKQILIDNLEYENNVDDVLVKTAEDVLHDEILNLVREYVRFDIAEMVDAIPDMAQGAIDKSKIAKKADIDVHRLELQDIEVYLTKHNIQFLISGRSYFEMALKKETFKPKTKEKKRK
jgi:hypothetical protein